MTTNNEMNCELTLKTTIGLTLALAACVATATDLPPAAQVLKETGVTAGLAVVVGTTDGALEAELTNEGKMLVQGLALSDEAALKARQHIFGKKFYGLASVSVVKTVTALPYCDRLINLLVADLDALGKDAPSKEEIDRVLGYEGVAYLKRDGKWTKTVKPTPKEVDSWTHAHYDASGNAVSKDLAMGPPNTFRWLDGPFGRYLIGGMRTSDGVAVQINPAYNEGLMNRSGTMPPELHGLFVWARDVNSGVPLWRRQFVGPGGPGCGDNVYYENFVAANGRVYVYDFMHPERVALVGLNIRTGEIERVFEKAVVARKAEARPTGALGNRSWLEWANHLFGYGVLLVRDGKLVQMVRNKIVVMNEADGEVLWEKSPPEGKVFIKAVIAGDRLLALCKPPYRRAASTASNLEELEQEEKRKPNDALELEAWQRDDGAPAWRVDLGRVECNEDGDAFAMLVSRHPHVLVNGVGACLDVRTGEKLWSGNRGATHGAHIVGDRIWCGGSGSSPFWGVRLLATGEGDGVRRNGGLNQSACDWPTVTPNWFMAKRNYIPIDPQPGGYEWLAFRPMGKQCAERGAASYGSVFMISAYCYCDHFLRGTGGFYAVKPVLAIPDAARLEKGGPHPIGPTTRQSEATKSLAAFAWGKPEGVRSLWGVGNFRGPRKAHACLQGYERTQTAEVPAGDVVLRAYPHEHRLAASRDGHEIWNFVAGGRIGYAPVVFKALAIFASHDGHVYAVNIADGTPAWRFLAAPADQRHMFFGQLESAWPVFNVVLDGGTVYFSAGRHEELDGGIHFYALDAATGTMRWHVQHRRGYESNRDPIRARKSSAGMKYVDESESKTPYDDRAFLNDAIELRDGKLHLFDKPLVDVSAPKDEILRSQSLVPPQFLGRQ